MKNDSIALILGLSPNGLSIARALYKSGIEVHIFENNAHLPAAKTKCGTVHSVDNMDEGNLINCLSKNRKLFSPSKNVVLFPTSDKAVREVGKNWHLLQDTYSISWSGCIDYVLGFLDKDTLHHACERKGIPYPRSVVYDGSEATEQCLANITFPAIVKPVRPLSSFKAVQVNTMDKVADLAAQYKTDLPFIVQDYISGDETSLFFHTMFVSQGRVLGEFTGRKLKSYPETLGIGTVLESTLNNEVRLLSRKFVEDSSFTGPIAIEFKQSQSGKLYLIEPNIGRTELSVDLVIQAGANMALIEFLVATDRQCEIKSEPLEPVIWFDTERDPLSYFKMCFEYKTFRPKGKKLVFAHLGHNDLMPFFYSLCLTASQMLKSLRRRMSTKRSI